MLLEGTGRKCAPAERRLHEDRATECLLALLPEDDRELLSLWASGQVSYRSMSRVLGCCTATVTRRIGQLRRRMEDPVVRTVVLHQRELPLKYREIAVRVLCRGEGLSEIARDLGLPRHKARQMLGDVVGWAKLRDSYLKESAS